MNEGELENYFQNIDNHYNLTRNSKTTYFLAERNYLISNNPTEEELNSRYGELIKILDNVSPETRVDYKGSLVTHIQDFVYSVQKICSKNNNLDIELLKENSIINYKIYQNILKLIGFEQTSNSFKCEIKIQNFEKELEQTIKFDEKVLPTSITLEE